MANASASKPRPIRVSDLRDFKYFKKLRGLLARLHDHATQRDKAHNRTLHYDQYICLILLHLFNPASQGLRSISQASAMPQVQKKLGVSYASLGSLSEAARVFDPALLEGLITELAAQRRQTLGDGRLDELDQIITLVDGTILKTLPAIAEAMWLKNASGNTHAAWRLHTHFELLSGVPVDMELTDARNSGDSAERSVLQARLQPDRLYVADRGYVKFSLFNAIVAAKSSYVCRLREDTVLEVQRTRELSEEDRVAGVILDQEVTLGSAGAGKPSAASDHPTRVIQIPVTPHVKRGGRKGKDAGPANGGMLLIVTNRLDLPAHLVALIYQYRYAIELFFRFFKQMLGCRHLISDCADGVRIQVYCAMIACLLLNLYLGRKVDRRTWEMLCYYMTGWASLGDLMAHLQKPDRRGEKLKAKDALWQKLGY